MKKSERKNMVQFQIEYCMKNLKEARSYYWATRYFENFMGTISAYLYIGEITESQRDGLMTEALDILTKKGQEESAI